MKDELLTVKVYIIYKRLGILKRQHLIHVYVHTSL